MDRYVKKRVKHGVVICLFMYLCYFFIHKDTADIDDESVRIRREKRVPLAEPATSEHTHGKREKELNEARDKLYSIERPPDEKYAINETRSQRISVDREIADNRPDQCRNKSYNISNLPNISVIIPMYNEAPSILLRTVHSILNRTPAQLLSDIIIVDDMSTNENMKKPLTDYMALLSPKVRILRLKKKAHLIRARMAGAAVAKGEVLLFQDGHTEMNVQWAEPVLDYILRHPKTIVQPQVDSIDQWSIQYEDRDNAMKVWRGVFLWDMRYAWHKTPSRYSAWTETAADPVPCPILVGCSIAVSKKYFEEIGGFDIGLDIWGGEQIELSFRAWMCGGRVVILPCSLTGHVFKPWMKSDVKWKEREQAISKNNIRIAESWMEGYASYYYASNWIYDFKKVNLSKGDLDGILERRELKKRLKCVNFDWFLDNILPELKEPPSGVAFYGEVNNEQSSKCLAAHDDGYIILTSDCYMYSRFNDQSELSFTKEGRLMLGHRCVRLDKNLLTLGSCDHTHETTHGAITFNLLPGHGMRQGKIIHVHKGNTYCLEQITNVLPKHYKEQMPQFSQCKDDNRFQVWNINYKFDYSLVPQPWFEGDTRFKGRR